MSPPNRSGMVTITTSSPCRVLISSMLDISGAYPGTLDIDGAITTKKVTPYRGEDPNTGDRIMAVSAPVIYNGNVVGVVRMVTSLRLVSRQMLNLTLIASGVALLILLITSVILPKFGVYIGHVKKEEGNREQG